ncbi:hypothetical protein N5B96_03160 [Acinetobacter johnsonii]|uniref:hypothetical protein n=1 Tax=Acinetobacter johnsonii TaxID=40214 RepID=UPI00244CD64B|nr:hypothetical protein [Acinetobacter johnsonii]MDH1068499.1 hypothetical protein [Acinetobacter johnsonii]
MPTTKNGCLTGLAAAGIELPSNALGIFSTITETKPISIVLKLDDQELCTLQFHMEDIINPDKAVTKIVGLSVEALLNQIPLLELVQNKN